jgi:hypothetical protein
VASQEELDRLVGRGMFDSGFLQQLIQDPEMTARSIGISLTPDQARRIRQIDPGAAEDLAKDFQRVIGPKPADW